ncbi:uncharacterized protein LOC127033274 isoform X3 [Gopherus flavomarginatus]|uniref:uncharacterized protein LOC127033274 isoform X3 n=1 Tax=Gopherus flavomarginatus TaxID=286002 RepID=UPI0021CC01AD|nr:uncharacterized protein LOC127033274 isoform X3 [Gopherus flavomarginatus]
MAAANPAKTLQDEVTCPICLEYFKDPVSLDCDHSFCRACITQCGEGFDTDISCPQCREIFPQRNLRLNRQLRNIVEAARELRLQPEPESLCEKHKEPLKLFCKEDEILICLVCDRSKEHRDHTVIPTEEAAEEFQEKIQAYLQTLREEREKLLGRKASVQMRSQEYLRKTRTERHKIVSEFQQLRQFLEEQERLLLGQLAELNEEIVKIQNENITKLSGEISRLSELVSEMEGKCQKPASEFLQDIKGTWSRCEKLKFEKPVAVPEDLRERVGVSSQRNICLQEAVKKFKETLPYQLNFLISKAEKEEFPAGERDWLPAGHLLYKAASWVWQETKLILLRGLQGAMAAAGNPLKSLRDEATCSICLSFFTDPVTIDCGHNFCRACIAQCWERPDTDISCPQCRETFPQRTLRPNRQLGNVAEIAKQLSVPAAAAAAGGLCNAHQEPFKLFCNQDQVLICVICRESQAHRAHRVLPIEEAAREHKDQIQTRLNILKQEREELLEWKQDGETQSQEYLGKIEAERQKIVSEFEQLRQFLEEQERLLLAQLEELDKEILKIQDENVTKLSKEISQLSDLISEIEEKCQQPTSEFLQDIRSTWSRCEKLKFEKPVAVPEDLRERVGVSSQRNICLQEALKKFKETLPYQLNFLISKAEKEVQATPDPDLAYPSSIVSTDESVLQKYQDTGYLVPQNRFYPAACLLGYTGFTSGRCYWEMEEKIQAHLKALREEREKLLGLKVTGEGKSQEYLKQTQTERQKIVSEFHAQRQFLEEQERLLLAQLEKLDEEIVRIQNENVSKLSEQISHLSELISEMEGKCQKPASEFLQGIRSILSRYVALSPSPSHFTTLGKSLVV